MDKRRYCAAPGCTNELPDYVRTDKHYCSDGCRKRAERARAKGVAVTGPVARGYTAVTDSPAPATPGARSSILSQAELDAKYPIPEDLTIPKWLRREPDAPHWKDYDRD